MEIRYLLDHRLLNHPGFYWGVWSLSFGLCFLFLFFLRRFFLKRFSPNYKWGQYHLAPTTRALIQQTKYFFLAACALSCARAFFPIPERFERLASQGTSLLFLIQAAIWGRCILDQWIDVLRRRAELDVGLAASLGLIQFAGNTVLYTTILVMALSHLGINITALITGLGVGGIAIALAAQKILGDLFASLTIVLDKPFTVGDSITVGDFSGTIELIGLRTTRLRSTSGEQIVFSNADLVQNKIRNFKRMRERQVLFSIQVRYDTRLESLEQIPEWIRSIIEKCETTRFERSHLSKLGDCGIGFETVYWITSPDYLTFANTHQNVCLQLLKTLRDKQVLIAHPTRIVLGAEADVRNQ